MPLKLTQRHAGKIWYLRGSIRGIRVDESTGTDDKKAAEEIRIRRERQLLDRSIHGDFHTRTFAEAALSYIDAGGEPYLLNPILLYFGPKKLLADIGQDEIEACAKKLMPKCAPATQNRKIYTPISAVLHHAARKKWCPKPTIARPQVPAGRVRWITEAEAERLIEAAADHIRPLLIFLLSTGARLSEALYLDWRDVDLSRGHVSLQGPQSADGQIKTKNNEARGIPLHPRAVAALANLPHRSGAVFRTPRKGMPPRPGKPDMRPLGEPYASRGGEGGGQISTAWAGMLRRAGIEDFTPHDCRHTWATWHYRENRDLAALMRLGGWKSVEMVLRYTHVNADDLAPSINRIWGKAKINAVLCSKHT